MYISYKVKMCAKQCVDFIWLFFVGFNACSNDARKDRNCLQKRALWLTVANLTQPGWKAVLWKKYWSDFCTRRFGDINYSKLIFITWRGDCRGLIGISGILCDQMTNHLPGPWFFGRFDDQYSPFFSPQLQDNLTLGQQGVLEDAQVDIRVNFQGRYQMRRGDLHHAWAYLSRGFFRVEEVELS